MPEMAVKSQRGLFKGQGKNNSPSPFLVLLGLILLCRSRMSGMRILGLSVSRWGGSEGRDYALLQVIVDGDMIIAFLAVERILGVCGRRSMYGTGCLFAMKAYHLCENLGHRC